MDSEDCSVSGASTSSLADVAEDRMVEMELEAAEALADLAHLAMRETGAPETSTNWGSKGKRDRKRVKSESPSSQSGLDLNLLDPAARSPDPADDQTIMDQQQDQTMSFDTIIKCVKAEQDAESLKPSPTCNPRYTSMSGGRSRQNLTEVEKEERRIRRILANRESARQTIRRRQALCEELTRKAAELAQENEYLKREKELALKDYQSLETINKHLKHQVAKAIKTEAGLPTFSLHIQSTHNMGRKMPSLFRQSFRILDNGSGLHAQPSYSLKNTQNETSMHNGDGASSSSRSITHVENHHFSLPIKIKDEAFGSTEARTNNDLNGIPVGCPPDGGGLHTGPRPREAKLTPAPLCSVGDKKQEPVSCPSKKLVDAAEARKRRKELTKLKNIHGRQCRMQC
ncbi:hypothetical protein ACOSP7_029909 [Xanthoceras sorbifolium]